MPRPARILPIERIRELVAAGASSYDISTELKCDRKALRKAMEADGIYTRWQGIRAAVRASEQGFERQAIVDVVPSAYARFAANPFRL